MDQFSRPRGSAPTLPLSLEAMLDEENKEVLANLDRQRSYSPVSKTSRNRTPPPYRSLLDVGPEQPRHGSIAGIGVGVTNPRDQRKPSKRLNPMDPSTWTSTAKNPPPSTTRTSPPQEPIESGTTPGLPQIQIDSKPDLGGMYNFDATLPSSTAGVSKTTQDTKPRGGSFTSGTGGSTERSAKEVKLPTTEYRTSSPKVGHLSPDSPQAKARTSSGSLPDRTYRRLSDKSNSFSTVTSDESTEASKRVLADKEADEDAVEESSEEEGRASSSDEDSPVAERGRRKERDADEDEEEEEKGKDNIVEQKAAPQSQGVRSLLEPVLSPSVPPEKSNEVHPPSSFGRSGPTAADFADEDEYESDIKKAKNMGMSISPLDSSVRDRHVRMIIRGEWAKFQDENENNNNSSPRLYLACTDLSTEASYSMEWTVGTMLRDGDTLLAIYAIEDENAPKEPEGNTQVMSESAQAATEAGDAMEQLTRQTTGLESKPATKFVPAIEAPTAVGSMNFHSLSKKEQERVKALDEITASFLKLVRKTPLQIRCMIEVIHCKSPKHLILNAIDALEPTLCVVGTRGRSSLKGVLLGSFSNYLVTKSSVPVMVARRRLKKPKHAKVNSMSIKMSNNLTNTGMVRARRSLTQARID